MRNCSENNLLTNVDFGEIIETVENTDEIYGEKQGKIFKVSPFRNIIEKEFKIRTKPNVEGKFIKKRSMTSSFHRLDGNTLKIYSSQTLL